MKFIGIVCLLEYVYFPNRLQDLSGPERTWLDPKEPKWIWANPRRFDRIRLSWDEPEFVWTSPFSTEHTEWDRTNPIRLDIKPIECGENLVESDRILTDFLGYSRVFRAYSYSFKSNRVRSDQIDFARAQSVFFGPNRIHSDLIDFVWFQSRLFGTNRAYWT